MDFFPVPDNPERTVLVSPNGVAHYQVRTSKASDGPRISRIQRPAECEEDSIVAEIEWKSWDAPTVVRCPLLKGLGRCIGKRGFGVRAAKFLYKKGKFSSSRYFVGNDNAEYRWKLVRGIGCVLTRSDTDEEVARYTRGVTEEGLFAGEKKSVLRIQPLCTVDIDLIILSFVIMEKKRREHAGDGSRIIAHDEDPQGDGGGDGGEA